MTAVLMIRHRSSPASANRVCNICSIRNDPVRPQELPKLRLSSTADVLLLCDANVFFAPDALRILVSDLSDVDVGAVTGKVILDSDQSNFGVGEKTYYRLERIVQESESRVGTLMGVDGARLRSKRVVVRRCSKQVSSYLSFELLAAGGFGGNVVEPRVVDNERR
ncbi:MAG: hypothetical protein FJ295_21815 [Planctomycetes bacterium]|nr:hypothetical protein [Planctomycetota bacterium]